MTPSNQQIERCAMMNWEYMGMGLFSRGEQMGWFTDKGFFKE